MCVITALFLRTNFYGPLFFPYNVKFKIVYLKWTIINFI